MHFVLQTIKEQSLIHWSITKVPMTRLCENQQKNHPNKTKYQPIVLIQKQIDFFLFEVISWKKYKNSCKQLCGVDRREKVIDKQSGSFKWMINKSKYINEFIVKEVYTNTYRRTKTQIVNLFIYSPGTKHSTSVFVRNNNNKNNDICDEWNRDRESKKKAHTYTHSAHTPTEAN